MIYNSENKELYLSGLNCRETILKFDEMNSFIAGTSPTHDTVNDAVGMFTSAIRDVVDPIFIKEFNPNGHDEVKCKYPPWADERYKYVKKCFFFSDPEIYLKNVPMILTGNAWFRQGEFKRNTVQIVGSHTVN